MIEYGLSVSLEGSPRSPPRQFPRSPSSQRPRSPPLSPSRSPPRSPSRSPSLSPQNLRSSHQTPWTHQVPQPPNCPRKIMKFVAVNRSSNDDDASMSPRILFAPPPAAAAPDNVRRRLEPSFAGLMDELSPVSFTSSTARGGGGGGGGGGDVCGIDCDCSDCSVGECGVCYENLPLRANHIFTMCGHLYCVRCLLKWWDTSTTCPVCRAELFADAKADDADDSDTDSDDADTEEDADADDAEADDADADTEEEYYDSDTTATTDDDDDDVTLMERYLHQDMFFENRYYTRRFYDGNSDSGESSNSDDSGDLDIRANFDDTIRTGNYSLTHSEFRHLRQTRKVAMNLYGRMVFREMLLSQEVEFRGDVRYCDDSVIPKSDWSQLLTTLAHQQYSDTVNIIMFEFVIRRGGSISPTNEVNLFGFIKEVRIIHTPQPGFFGVDWNNLHEYAFLASVFTYSCEYSRSLGHTFIEYGSYDMTEGTISPTDLIIPFSQIRRLYRMRGCERIAYNVGGGGAQD